MTIRAQAEAAVSSQVRPGLVTRVSHSLAIPCYHRRPRALPARQPLGQGRAQGSILRAVNPLLAISSHPCERALVFMVPAWKNHRPGLSFSTHAAMSAGHGERSSLHGCGPLGPAQVPWGEQPWAPWLKSSLSLHTTLDQRFKAKLNSFYYLSFNTALFISLRNIRQSHMFITRI